MAKARRSLPRSLCLAVCLAVLGCGPLVVSADPAGAQKLPLPGEPSVVGVVERELLFEGAAIPKGAEVRVDETWLLRHDKNARPAGYRISGLYDPTTQTDGLALPRHAIDTYYVGVVLPAARQRVAVPAEHFRRR